jgi:hypothetical protein
MNRKLPPARHPITSHHLFPVGIALWFGALFSLSSLAVRADLFDQIVFASHFDALLPAAAPPLGHLARLLLALGFGAIGLLLGICVARLAVKLSGATAVPNTAPSGPAPEPFRVRARDAHPDAPARRPVSARDELPDAAPIALKQGAACSEPEIIAAAEPANFESARAEAVARPEPAAAPLAIADIAPLEPAKAAPVLAKPILAKPSAPFATTAERIAGADPAELSQVELIERLAIAMQRRVLIEAQKNAATDGSAPIAESAVPFAPVRAVSPQHRAHLAQNTNSKTPDSAQIGDDERIATLKSLRDTLSALKTGSA